MKICVPLVPVGHPDFKWRQNGDVQAIWRKYGWTPPSEAKKQPAPAAPLRSVR